MRPKRDAFRHMPATFFSFVILITLMPCLLFCRQGYSQEGEFGKNTTGLIYSDQTIQQLKYIVDSLNLKFKVCATNPKYRTFPQGVGHYVYLRKGKIAEAKKDMDQDMAFETFVQKYSPLEVKRSLLVVRLQGETYEGNPEVSFSSVRLGEEDSPCLSFEEDLNQYKGPLKGKWIYHYQPGDKNDPAMLMAFYFPDGLKQQFLPENYARLVQYADCLIDTTALVFKREVKESQWENDFKTQTKVSQFIQFVHRETGKPELKGKREEAFYKKYNHWYANRMAILDTFLAKTAAFKNRLSEAVVEALDKGNTGDEFEEYVQQYYSPETALALKRSRKVIGTCSQDPSPRNHAFSIARLSAETINWEIFLRAHLDIMNDRFERSSDGSYAWAARKTYIRELEVLDINVPDLLFGITLRLNNPAENHYFGSISRIGRALSESGQASQMEIEMLKFIQDNQLDDYNRILMYYLFLNYNHYVNDKEKQAENRNKLNEAVKALPAYLASRAIIKN